MAQLILVSLIWGFSFGLYKDHLVALDPNFVACFRLLLALPLFLPLLRCSNLRKAIQGRLLLTGAVQYGIMYASLNLSYRFLEAWQVALFTILTPLYVTLLDDLFQRRFQRRDAVLTLIGIIATAYIIAPSRSIDATITGFLILQGSNLAFAFGQVYYRRLHQQIPDIPQHRVFALLYLGGALITALATTLSSFGPGENAGWSSIHALGTTQIWLILYLGVIASGLAFFLWNYGATKVSAGTLATMNNLKIPAAILCSLLFFGGDPDPLRLALGGALLLIVLILHQSHPHKRHAQSPRS